MKILLLMDPFIPVPPERYGGIERVIYDIACKYVEMGHSVTIIAGPGSKSPGRLIIYGQNGEGSMRIDYKLLWEVRKILLKEIPGHDVLHNFGRLAFLLPVAWTKIKKVQTYMRFITPQNIRLLNKSGIRNVTYTGVSDAIVSTGEPGGGHWATVYNCAPVMQFTFRETVEEDAPLVFLGRLERCKGAHSAIKAARLANRKLIIAGNISTLPDEKAYFEKEVLPEVDNKLIFYVGEVDNTQKNELLGNAAALLLPIEWFEPFPVVMPEAYACGTPVLAFPGGGVPEGIVEGSTGFLSNSPEEMAAQIKRIATLSRKACRELAIKRYSDTEIANEYLTVYRSVKNDGEGNHSTAEKKRIVIVTTGQPSTNPRVIKEYEALIVRGYDVKVLYTYSAEWAYQIDKGKFDKGILDPDDFILIGGDPYSQKFMFFLSRVFLRLFKSATSIIPSQFIKNAAISRTAFFIWWRAQSYKADIYIAHYVGALAGAARAAKKNKALLMFDAEDYHRGETDYYTGQSEHIAQIENKYLPQTSCITAASPLIADAYKKLFPQKKVITINNVFSKKFLQKPPAENNNSPLKLFWFSQNIGPMRGLELIVEALNILGKNVELYLLGNDKRPGYIDNLVKSLQPPASIHLLKPVDPDNIFEIAARYDAGLASEVPHCENRNICLTNKIFTYLLAGNCILASDTAAQKYFLDNYKGIGLVYGYSNATELAEKIDALITNRQQLSSFRHTALELAANELNWECERQKLYEAVDELMYKHSNAQGK